MRSVHGFWASVVFLVTLPVALACQAVFAIDAELVVHFGFAAALMVLTPLDFDTPRWLKWLGLLTVSCLGWTFLLQFSAPVYGSAFLTWLAFEVLGQWPESLFISLLLIWLAGVLLTDSRGKTRILGWICLLPAIGVMAYSYILTALGTSLNDTFPVLKVLLLLPFVWLLFESRKPRESVVSEAAI
jgi:hypothetical protein